MSWMIVLIYPICIGFWVYWAIHDHPSYDEGPYIPYGPDFDKR